MMEIDKGQMQAFQDYYPDDYSHCYGCGRLNEKGHRIKSYWEGEKSVCRLKPPSFYSGGRKNILYGGLIASLIDCHGAATAAAAKAKEQQVVLGPGKMPRFVTASLKIDYLAPVPIDCEIEMRAKATRVDGRKVGVEVTLLAEDRICAKGEGLFIQVRDGM